VSVWELVSRRGRRDDGLTRWRRELAEQVSVAVDGLVELADTVPARRPVGRVVVSMPDFVADTVAHLLAIGCRVATEDASRDEADTPGPEERALAEALFAASRAAGYRCPTGELDVPRAVVR
jgi:hypothetical protein